MTFDIYRLPDGSYVQVDATAAKGADEIDYTLKGGAIVKAKLVAVGAFQDRRLKHVPCGGTIARHVRTLISRPADAHWPRDLDLNVPYCTTCQQVVNYTDIDFRGGQRGKEAT